MSSTKVEDLVKSKIKEAMEKRKITTSTEHWVDLDPPAHPTGVSVEVSTLMCY
jgi:hypothetical protein